MTKPALSFNNINATTIAKTRFGHLNKWDYSWSWLACFEVGGTNAGNWLYFCLARIIWVVFLCRGCKKDNKAVRKVMPLRQTQNSAASLINFCQANNVLLVSYYLACDSFQKLKYINWYLMNFTGVNNRYFLNCCD